MEKKLKNTGYPMEPYTVASISLCALRKVKVRSKVLSSTWTIRLYSEKEYVKSGYKAVSDYLGGGYEEKLWGFFEAGKPAIDELLKELGQRERESRSIKGLPFSQA
jgi:hypothetical protein